MPTTLLLLAALGPVQAEHTTTPPVLAADLASHIRTLASDEFGGRAPGTPGGEATVRYLIDRFASYGLEPAGEVLSGEQRWIQPVPMMELTPKGSPTVAATAGGTEVPLVFGRDVMLWSPVTRGPVDLVENEVVFAGYGIVAPEYGWNDYEGLDVAGKTVLVMVNDPGYATGDPELFRGSAMTYYGRWTYKFEEAARQRAAACLIVHEDGAAGYGWPVVLQSWGQPQLQLQGSSVDERTDVQGWITKDMAGLMLRAGGVDADAAFAAASTRQARSVEVDARFSTRIENQLRTIGSSNVAAKVTGATRPDETVLVCAHWDHLGTREGREDEDNVFNGAFDNATGTAAMLELAHAVASMDPPPSRTVLFVAMTAEEKGLLGSAWYAANPLRPLASTVCGLNIDGVNVLGPMEDVVIIGYGASELDDDLRAVAAAQGRRVVPESTPEKGYYFRSDHFSLAKVGVPMLFTGDGTVSVMHGEEWVTERKNEFLRKRYHRVGDEFDPEWDLGGAEEDVRLFQALVTLWANMPGGRSWSPDSEFRAARERSKKRQRVETRDWSEYMRLLNESDLEKRKRPDGEK
ncbi:MAG: M20/M25/M40 family metallo-hydrolase [Planctomycetota bacterium]